MPPIAEYSAGITFLSKFAVVIGRRRLAQNAELRAPGRDLMEHANAIKNNYCRCSNDNGQDPKATKLQFRSLIILFDLMELRCGLRASRLRCLSKNLSEMLEILYRR